MSQTKEEIIDLFDKDDINKRVIEKDVRSRFFNRILKEETFSKPVDLSSTTSKEAYTMSIYSNIFGFIQLQARVCNVESIQAIRNLQGGPSLFINYSYMHLLTRDKCEEVVEINSDERTWGINEVNEEDAKKFVYHLDNLCYALEQVQWI